VKEGGDALCSSEGQGFTLNWASRREKMDCWNFSHSYHWGDYSLLSI